MIFSKSESKEEAEFAWHMGMVPAPELPRQAQAPSAGSSAPVTILAPLSPIRSRSGLDSLALPLRAWCPVCGRRGGLGLEWDGAAAPAWVYRCSAPYPHEWDPPLLPYHPWPNLWGYPDP